MNHSSKHTPGPWQWWDKKGGRPPGYDLAKLHGPNGKSIISNMYGGEGLKALGKTSTDEANARLIAAAPELYAALNEILLDPMDPDGEKFDRATRAIAKAEGRE